MKHIKKLGLVLNLWFYQGKQSFCIVDDNCDNEVFIDVDSMEELINLKDVPLIIDSTRLTIET